MVEIESTDGSRCIVCGSQLLFRSIGAMKFFLYRDPFRRKATVYFIGKHSRQILIVEVNHLIIHGLVFRGHHKLDVGRHIEYFKL